MTSKASALSSHSFLDAQVFFVLTPVNPFQAQYGANVTLHWDYTGNKPLTLAQWGTLDGENGLQTIIAQQHGNSDVQYLSSYKGRAFIQGRASLTLIDVKESDSGQYGCQLTFEGEISPIINSTRLLVLGRLIYQNISNNILFNIYYISKRFIIIINLYLFNLYLYTTTPPPPLKKFFFPILSRGCTCPRQIMITLPFRRARQ